MLGEEWRGHLTSILSELFLHDSFYSVSIKQPTRPHAMSQTPNEICQEARPQQHHRAEYEIKRAFLQ